MVKTRGLEAYSDCHHTDLEVARRVVRYFRPRGSSIGRTQRYLEPFAGNGAFFEALKEWVLGPVYWCEVEEGRDFLGWTEQVDWIITNPPYSNLTEVMARCFEVASRTVLLVPMSKVYSSAPRLELVRDLAGIEEQLVLGAGRDIGFDSGFPFAAMLFTRGYRGPTRTTWAWAPPAPPPRGTWASFAHWDSDPRRGGEDPGDDDQDDPALDCFGDVHY
jgi:hypothetical protein